MDCAAFKRLCLLPVLAPGKPSHGSLSAWPRSCWPTHHWCASRCASAAFLSSSTFGRPICCPRARRASRAAARRSQPSSSSSSARLASTPATLRGVEIGGDELVTAHLQEHQKIRNIRRDPRVAVTIVSTDRSGPQTPYLSIKGTARVEEGGAPELLDEIATTIFGPGTGFPPPDAPPGYLTHITIEKVGGVGPWAT
jgi:Pyridoxamine 5'-phosphate oxidase